MPNGQKSAPTRNPQQEVDRIFITPPPIGIGGRGIVFARFLSFFLSFFVSLSARLRENGWTDLREIFRESVE